MVSKDANKDIARQLQLDEASLSPLVKYDFRSTFVIRVDLAVA